MRLNKFIALNLPTSRRKADELIQSGEVIFNGTSVDGVYDSDPKKNSDSKMYENISYKRVLSDNFRGFC